MNDTEANSVMTVREISEFLRLTETTVYKLLQEGKLPGRKVGGQWRCSHQSLNQWLAGSLTSRQEDLEKKEVYLETSD